MTLIDVALLTDKGIVFCMIPSKTLDRFKQLAVESKPDEQAVAVIEVENRIVYEVTCENILVRYEPRR